MTKVFGALLLLNVSNDKCDFDYVNKNDNGYDNFLFKYSNIIEEQVVIITDSNNTIMTIGRKSGCIYAYQFKQEIGLSEFNEIRDAALKDHNGVRYQTNIKSLSNLIEHIYAKIKDTLKDRNI